MNKYYWNNGSHREEFFALSDEYALMSAPLCAYVFKCDKEKIAQAAPNEECYPCIGISKRSRNAAA